MATQVVLAGTVASGTNVDLTASLRYVTSIDVIEVAGTPALARLYVRDTNASGAVQIPINLAASGSFSKTYQKPVKFPGGVYLNPQSGSMRYSIVGYA